MARKSHIHRILPHKRSKGQKLGRKRRFNIHGCFSSKAEAMKKEKEVKGGFIKKAVNGKYCVLSPR